MTRINCHSSLKHYEMYHSGCGGGSNYGSIFNTTYNIDCNGHSGFWGGFGYGLGNAIGGLFSGLFRGGMNFNCFGMGGFGMGGFGFPGFGGFNFGNFGVPSLGGIFGDRSKVSDSEDSEKTESKEKKEADDKKDKECEDPDRQKLADHVASVKTLFADEQNLTPDTLKELYNKIKTDMESSKEEPHHTTTDLREYESLLNILNDKAKAKGWGEIESEDFGKSSSAATTDPAATDPAATPATPNEETLDNLTVDQINDLKKDDISKLTPDNAKKLLEKLGITEGEVIKDANNITVLLLLEKAGIDVKIAQNTDESVKDEWILGKISNVNVDEDGKISYLVDCSKNGTQKNKYKFAQQEKDSNKYTVTVKKFGEGTTYAKSDTKSVEYTYDATKGHLTRNGYKFTTEL